MKKIKMCNIILLVCIFIIFNSFEVRAASVTEAFDMGIDLAANDMTFSWYTFDGKKAYVTYDDSYLTLSDEPDMGITIRECIKSNDDNWNLVLPYYGASNITGDLFIVYDYDMMITSLKKNATFEFKFPEINGYEIAYYSCDKNVGNIPRTYHQPIPGYSIKYQTDQDYNFTRNTHWGIYIAIMYKKPTIPYI